MPDIKDVIEESTRRFDTFRTILGLVMLSVAGYLWLKYFLNLKIETSLYQFIFNNINYYVLFWILIILIILGLFFFITGITEMEDNYDLEKTILQVRVLKSLEKIEKLKFKNLGLSKKAKGKFKKNIKQKYEDIIKGFE